ncbi:hypothetical protein V1281_005821 [Nitrobacteraceae bacterium AZCC 2161]
MKQFRLALTAFFLIVSEMCFAGAAPKDVAKTVTFIFLADENGNPKIDNGIPVANGTGFLVIVENENGPGGYGYLVTAKHVLKNEKGEYFKRVYVRLNDKHAGSGFIEMNLTSSGPDQNIYVHDDPTVDIAVVPGLPNQELFDFLAVPMSMIKNKEDFKKSTISAGSDVFFTGLFAPHFGDKVNTPIFRFGRVAMITDDRFRWQENATKPVELVELYLLETMSFGGRDRSRWRGKGSRVEPVSFPAAVFQCTGRHATSISGPLAASPCRSVTRGRRSRHHRHRLRRRLRRPLEFCPQLPSRRWHLATRIPADLPGKPQDSPRSAGRILTRVAPKRDPRQGRSSCTTTSD